MSSVQEWMGQEVPEGGSAFLTAYFEDENGDAIPLAGLSAVTLWLDNQATGATINSRAAVDVRNANGGTVTEITGPPARTKFRFRLTPADNVLVDSTLKWEAHIATISATYNGGADVVRKEILFHVINLSEI
jgi:hypothetical protein